MLSPLHSPMTENNTWKTDETCLPFRAKQAPKRKQRSQIWENQLLGSKNETISIRVAVVALVVAWMLPGVQIAATFDPERLRLVDQMGEGPSALLVRGNVPLDRQGKFDPHMVLETIHYQLNIDADLKDSKLIVVSLLSDRQSDEKAALAEQTRHVRFQKEQLQERRGPSPTNCGELVCRTFSVQCLEPAVMEPVASRRRGLEFGGGNSRVALAIIITWRKEGFSCRLHSLHAGNGPDGTSGGRLQLTLPEWRIVTSTGQLGRRVVSKASGQQER